MSGRTGQRRDGQRHACLDWWHTCPAGSSAVLGTSSTTLPAENKKHSHDQPILPDTGYRIQYRIQDTAYTPDRRFLRIAHSGVVLCFYSTFIFLFSFDGGAPPPALSNPPEPESRNLACWHTSEGEDLWPTGESPPYSCLHPKYQSPCLSERTTKKKKNFISLLSFFCLLLINFFQMYLLTCFLLLLHIPLLGTEQSAQWNSLRGWGEVSVYDYTVYTCPQEIWFGDGFWLID